MFKRYPIHHLIEGRLKALGLSRGHLASRCGFRNVSKGLRRIGALCDGDLAARGSAKVIAALPAALVVDESVVEQTLRETAEIVAEAERQAAAEGEAAWRASFVPCAYLLGTETRPSQITIYGITGGADRWRKIKLDLARPPVTFVAQALAVVKKTAVVPFFGPTTGFIVNYTPDSAVRYDLNGNPVESFDRVYTPGTVDVFVGKRKLPEVWGFGEPRRVC